MNDAQEALKKILLIGIDDEPQEVLVLKARTVIAKFWADLSAAYQGVASVDVKRLVLAREFAKLRDAVDLEIDRRVDEDLADNVCDLLEELSGYLHAEIGDPQELSNKVDANVTGNTVSSNIGPRHA